MRGASAEETPGVFPLNLPKHSNHSSSYQRMFQPCKESSPRSFSRVFLYFWPPSQRTEVEKLEGPQSINTCDYTTYLWRTRTVLRDTNHAENILLLLLLLAATLVLVLRITRVGEVEKKVKAWQGLGSCDNVINAPVSQASEFMRYSLITILYYLAGVSPFLPADR